MPLTDNFLGRIQTISSLVITPAGGSPAAADIQGILNLNPPTRQFKTSKYTPISGTLKGKEQVISCSEQASQIKITALYEPAHYAALETVAGINGAAIVLTLSDGSVFTGVGALTENAVQQITDSKEVEVSQTIDLNAGWTYAAGS
jgi:hypothetical protein